MYVCVCVCIMYVCNMMDRLICYRGKANLQTGL